MKENANIFLDEKYSEEPKEFFAEKIRNYNETNNVNKHFGIDPFGNVDNQIKFKENMYQKISYKNQFSNFKNMKNSRIKVPYSF